MLPSLTICRCRAGHLPHKSQTTDRKCGGIVPDSFVAVSYSGPWRCGFAPIPAWFRFFAEVTCATAARDPVVRP